LFLSFCVLFSPGGTKFIHRSMLIKLPEDAEISPGHFLYGGSAPSLELASKGVANELRASTRLFRQLLDLDASICFDATCPVMHFAEFLGHRLVVMPLLPLGKGSSRLVYGSDDGGPTVHNDVVEVSELMVQLGGKLNTASHVVVSRGNDRVPRELVFAGDVELHVEASGRVFVLDLGRVFPPEAPQVSSHLGVGSSRDVFHKMHRPEFLTGGWIKTLTDLHKRTRSKEDKLLPSEEKEVTFTPHYLCLCLANPTCAY
jgi:hypothetical protein